MLTETDLNLIKNEMIKMRIEELQIELAARSSYVLNTDQIIKSNIIRKKIEGLNSIPLQILQNEPS